MAEQWNVSEAVECLESGGHLNWSNFPSAELKILNSEIFNGEETAKSTIALVAKEDGSFVNIELVGGGSKIRLNIIRNDHPEEIVAYYQKNQDKLEYYEFNAVYRKFEQREKDTIDGIKLDLNEFQALLVANKQWESGSGRSNKVELLLKIQSFWVRVWPGSILRAGDDQYESSAGYNQKIEFGF